MAGLGSGVSRWVPSPLERRYLSPAERGAAWRRRAALAGVAVAGVLLLSWLDGPAYRLLAIPQGPRRDGVVSQDWYQALRQLGYLPVWLFVAGLVWLVDEARQRAAAGLPGGVGGGVGAFETERAWPPKPAHHRAGLLVLAPLLAGWAAALLKWAIGRSRPQPPDGDTFWGGGVWADLGLSGGWPEGVSEGLPSGHTTVAFAACAMAGLLWPAARWPLLLVAAGCGLTRLIAGAHTLSDAAAGALLGAAVAWGLFTTGEGRR